MSAATKSTPKFSPAEQWLRRNGFPALVPGFGSWRMYLRNPWPMIAAAVGWALTFYIALVIGIAVRGLLATADPVSVADSERAIDSIINSSVVGTHGTLVVLGCLVLGAVFSTLSVGSIALFSIGWFVTVARRSSGRLFTVLPLLMVAVMFFFLAAETWQSVGSLDDTPFFFACALLALLSLGFLMARSRSDLDSITDFDSIDELREALPKASKSVVFRALGLTQEPTWTVPAAALPSPSLRRLERSNVRSIVVLGKFIASLLVALIVGLFFLTLGTIAVTDETASAWLGHEPNTVLAFTPISHTYYVFAETIRVSIFLATFSALYFVVSATSDKEFASSLSHDTEEHLRTAFAVRAIAAAEAAKRPQRRRSAKQT